MRTQRHGKPQSIIGCMLLGLLILGCSSNFTLAKPIDLRQCRTVSGALLINFVDETTAIAVATGSLEGGVRGVILEKTPGENGMLTLRSKHTITTEAGDLLLTSDTATLAPMKENTFYMNMTQNVVGGGGSYAKATGSMDSFGAVDFGVAQGILRYSGKLCGIG